MVILNEKMVLVHANREGGERESDATHFVWREMFLFLIILSTNWTKSAVTYGFESMENRHKRDKKN